MRFPYYITLLGLLCVSRCFLPQSQCFPGASHVTCFKGFKITYVCAGVDRMNLKCYIRIVNS